MTRNFDPESDFQTLFEASPDLNLVLDPDRQIVAVRPEGRSGYCLTEGTRHPLGDTAVAAKSR
jgi:PAS domain-containing protein